MACATVFSFSQDVGFLGFQSRFTTCGHGVFRVVQKTNVVETLVSRLLTGNFKPLSTEHFPRNLKFGPQGLSQALKGFS